MSIEVISRDLEPPAELVRRIREIGGISPHGEPNFRIIWGWKRLTWKGGRWAKFDSNGNRMGESIETRLQPKYMLWPTVPNRWYFEMWLPPEAYGTPESWEREHTEWIAGVRVETLGPFPRKGDYEQVTVLQTPLVGACIKEGLCVCGGVRGCWQYAPLTPLIAEACVRMAIANRNLPQAVRRLARHEREQHEEESAVNAALDKLEERRPAFGGEAMVTVPRIITP